MIKVAKPCIGDEEIQAVTEVLKSGRYVQGPKVKEFEEKFAKYIGTNYGIAEASGTDALIDTLTSLGIEKGDEVIVPALTFFATVEAVLFVRAIPVFVDIDSETYCLDPHDLKKRITEKTKAVIPVHLYGHPADMDEITSFLPNDIWIVEDAAQAHGAEYKNQKVGSLGDAGCWSFFATKNMTTGTEGGMITTNNERLTREARLIRSHGMVDRNTHIILGGNHRLSEIGAAIGIIQLSKLDQFNALRTRNSMYLLDNLRDIEWMQLPKIKSYVKHVFFWFPVRIDEEKLGMTTRELINVLRKSGVEVRHRYYKPLYKQPVLVGMNPAYEDIHLSNVEKIAGKMIGLPNHPGLDAKALDRVISAIKSI